MQRLTINHCDTPTAPSVMYSPVDITIRVYVIIHHQTNQVDAGSKLMLARHVWRTHAHTSMPYDRQHAPQLLGLCAAIGALQLVFHTLQQFCIALHVLTSTSGCVWHHDAV